MKRIMMTTCVCLLFFTSIIGLAPKPAKAADTNDIINGATYKIKSMASGNYLDTDGNGTVILAPGSTYDDQDWIVTKDFNGFWTIKNARTGRYYLETQEADNNVIWNLGTISDSSLWSIEQAGEDVVRFKNKSSARVYMYANSANQLKWNSGSADPSTLWELELVYSETTPVVTVKNAFQPGKVWTDTEGKPIDAHGPGIMYDDISQKYYWYGEYHTGTWPAAGIRVYSSTDLYNWKDEGMALTKVNTMEDFTNDPLISKLYAGRTDTYDIWADIRQGRIIERPKVIYNEKTKKYVMWAHIDGDKSAESDAQNYGKAKAGYAISDSPIGPFIYQKSYRMDMTPPDQTDYWPQDRGMARDMNLFKDDDGTAYLIYSSEENKTIYISKLLDDYSDVVGWHKDGNVDENGNPVRDTTYKAEYGVDYIRVFPNGVREAPALFKYNGKYYLMTSSATGWSPNENLYSLADNIMGPWSTMTNPFIRMAPSDPDPQRAFNSQMSTVIPIDPANGKYIYVGDDWNGGNFSTNGGAKYVWLPIEFGQESDLSIKWYSTWSKDLLNHMAGVTTDINLPEVVAAGKQIELPNEVQVKPIGSTVTSTTPIQWFVNSQPVTESTFAMPGTYALDAMLPNFNNKTLRFTISVVPENAVYFVNSGGQATEDYKRMASFLEHTLINKTVVDQEYDPTSKIPWGYIASKMSTAGSAGGNIFNTLRYLDAGNVVNSSYGTDLEYKFTVNNGSYTVYTGFNDIWSNPSRKADLYINGEKKTAITYISNTVYQNKVNVTDGTIDIIVRNTAAENPLINWIMIAGDNSEPKDQTKPVTTLVLADAGNNGWYKSRVVTLYATDESSGVAKTEYKIGDSGDWQEYTGPFELTQDGSYTIYYRSTDKAGNVEDVGKQSFKIDQTSLTFQMIVNGNVLKEGDLFEDDQSLTFQASDNVSGLVSAQISIGNSVYSLDLAKEPKIDIDLAGRPGSHSAEIAIEDVAGNKLQYSFQFKVETNINSMLRLLDRFEAQLSKPLLSQLRNTLMQTQHQLDNGRRDHAVKHMEDFIKHLDDEARDEGVKSVKSILRADANALIEQWSRS